MAVAKFQYILNNYNAIKLEKNKVFIFFNFLKNLKTLLGAIEVVIYNFLALLTIDININQFIKVYHIFDKIQYKN